MRAFLELVLKNNSNKNMGIKIQKRSLLPFDLTLLLYVFVHPRVDFFKELPKSEPVWFDVCR